MIMIKYTFIAIGFLGLMSCNQTNENKSNTQNDEANIVLSKTEALVNLTEEAETSTTPESKLVFKASGSEPGWAAEFYSDKMRLLYNYGQDSIWIKDSFVDAYGDKGFNYKGVAAVQGAEVPLIISVQNQKCTDMAGNIADRVVTIKLGVTEYKGCGGL